MTTAGLDAPGRAKIDAKTLRQDRWWIQPAITAFVLVSFIIYSTWRAFANANYFVEPYISPFYSPCLSDSGCGDAPSIGLFPSNAFFTPAIFILIFPLSFISSARVALTEAIDSASASGAKPASSANAASVRPR